MNSQSAVRTIQHPVGYFSQSESPYGTFDQGGNVWEWNEDSLESSMHRRRGGAYNADLYGLESTYRNYSDSAFENGAIGFRIASVPEPGSLMMILGIAIMGGLMYWKRRKA